MSTHFEHVAKSLGVIYIKKFIENRFEHGMSTGIVKISKEALNEVVEFLDKMGRNKRRLQSDNKAVKKIVTTFDICILHVKIVIYVRTFPNIMHPSF